VIQRPGVRMCGSGAAPRTRLPGVVETCGPRISRKMLHVENSTAVLIRPNA
jgi:hypothetical protein